jgi:uncharacterized membrane protein
MTYDPPPSAVVHSTHTPERHVEPASIEGEIQRTTWFDFAAMLLFIVGFLNIIDGIAAISDSRYLSHTQLFANAHAWGWFFLIWGVIQLFAAFAVFREATWGIAVAIATAGFNLIAQLSNAKAYPVWSLAIATLDVLIIYALIVHRRRA